MNAAETPYQVELDRFQGPLELLLHLIRAQELNIFDIPIARITAQFLDAVRSAPPTELQRAGEFLELAATLLHIKGRMLLPVHEGVEEQTDPRADLVRRLLEFEHFRDVSQRLADAESARGRCFTRGHVEVRPRPAAANAPLHTAWAELLAAAREVAARAELPEPELRIAPRPVRVADKMELVRAALRGTPRVEFAALVAPWGTRGHAVASLLACLELARRSALRLRQAAAFAPLWLLRPAAPR